MASESLAKNEAVDFNPQRLSQNGKLVGIGVYGFLIFIAFFIGIVTGYEKPQVVVVAKKETTKEPTKVLEAKSEKPKAVSNKPPQPEAKQETKVEDSKPKEPKSEDPKPQVAKPENPKPKPSPPPTPAQLVEFLGSTDEAAREKAEAALRAMGKTAESVLRDGTKSSDPAVAKKSQELLVAIVGEPKKEPKKEVAKATFKEVSAILRTHCANCHGAVGKPRDDVDVTTYDKLMKSPSGIGKSVVPGDDKKSGILAAIVGGSMPPDGKPKPTEGEVAIIRNWILSGAKPRRNRKLRRG